MGALFLNAEKEKSEDLETDHSRRIKECQNALKQEPAWHVEGWQRRQAEQTELTPCLRAELCHLFTV